MGACFENGVFLAALSSFFFSLCSLLAKFLVRFHPVQLSWFSFLGIVIVSGVSVVRRKENLFPRELRLHLVGRSVAGTLFLVSSFYSVQLISLGDASVLFYTAPAFTVFFAKWLIKEPCSFKNIVMICVTMTCVILVMKPPIMFGSTDMTNNYLLGVILAITASLSDSLGNIALRDMRSVHFSVVLFGYSLISLLFTTVISILFSKWSVMNFFEFILILVLVMLNSVEQILMTIALKFEHAGTVALAQATDIIYGYTFQVLFFKEAIDFWSVFGVIVIALMIMIMSLGSKRKKIDKVIVLHY